MDSSILNTLKSIESCNFFVLDKEYKYISFSYSHSTIMEKIWGGKISEGKSIFEFIKDENDAKKAKKNFDRVLNRETIVLKENYGDSNFFRTMWRNSYSPIYDKNKKIVGIFVLVEELTEHIKLENRFNELQVFENIINKLSAGITLVDPNQEDMPIIFVNNGFCKTTGYKKEEVLGKNFRFLRKGLEDQDNIRTINDAIKSKKTCVVDLINYKKDGTKFINLINISPVFDKDGELVYYIGVQIDVTKEVQKGEMNTIKTIASGLTHEINTALVSLDGNIDLISYDIEDIKDEKLQSYMLESLEKIKESKSIINKIVNSLHYLNISSLERNKENLDIYNTLKESIEFFSEKINKRQIDLKVNLKPIESIDTKLEIFAEKKSLIHLWEIIIENSIDAVCEKESNKNIDILVEKNTKNIKISIKDNGFGIDKKIQKDLFKPLVKGKSYRGVGLNLFIAKMIVQMHNGIIGFNSDKNGTVFDIVLNSNT